MSSIERRLDAIDHRLSAIEDKLGDHHRHLLKILQNQEKIMSAISEYAAKQNVHNDKMDTAIADLIVDVKSLNDKIAELQNTAGQVTQEDQALLDALEVRGASIADKLDALDAQTPPPVPAAP